MWSIISKMFHNNPLFRCYFGNKKDVLNPKEYLALSHVQDILTLQPFLHIKQPMFLQKLIFLHQTHSTEGLSIIDSNSAMSQASFSQKGDYLITNQKNIFIQGLPFLVFLSLPLAWYITVIPEWEKAMIEIKELITEDGVTGINIALENISKT